MLGWLADWWYLLCDYYFFTQVNKAGAKLRVHEAVGVEGEASLYINLCRM